MAAEKDDRVENTRKMRALTDDQRSDAIAASSNVIGFERFQEKAKQVALRDAYRRPVSGDGPKLG